MSQNWNPDGVKFFFRTLVNPRLIVPHLRVYDISQLSPEALKEAGVKAVVFDKDNTLTNPYEEYAHPSIVCALDRFKRVFEKVAGYSNHAATPDDENNRFAKSLEETLRIPFIGHQKKKPSGGEEVINYFCCNPQNILVVGDRILTDIAFGNRYGMLTALVRPFTLKGDNRVARICRPLENFLLWQATQLGYSASKNPIAEKYRSLMSQQP